MEKKLKNRLIGMALLVTLMIVLIPLFRSHPEDINKPEAKTETVAFPMEETTDLNNNTKPVADIATPVTSVATNDTKPVTVIHDNPVPDSDEKIVDTHPMQEVVENRQGNAVIKESNVMAVASTPVKVTETKALDSKKIVSDKKSVVVAKPVQTIKTVIKPKKTTTQTAFQDNGLSTIHHATWLVQVSSFAKKENALDLAKKLRAQGHSVITQKISQPNKTVYRIYVGPLKLAATADQVADKIKRTQHVSGIVIRYNPSV